MTSKERVLSALNHKQPDKVPLDFGGCTCSCMHVTCVEALREYYGLEKHPVKISEVSTMTGVIEPDLQEAIGVDLEGINGYACSFGFPYEDWKEWDYFGHKVLVPGKFEVDPDGRGGWLIYPQGDRTAEPSGHMPENGFYFDNIMRQKEEVDEDNLDYHDNIEEYGPVPDAQLKFFADRAEALSKTGRAVTASFGGMGLGDASEIPGPGLLKPKGIRTVEDWYMAPLLYPDYVHDIFEAETDIAIQNLEKYWQAVGDKIDVAFICGTDFGTQRAQFCSVDQFREFYLPYYKKINDWIHGHTNWKTLKHSCGAVDPIIPLFIEAGFDALNPVQCSAAGMDAKHLKETYGKDITFWGGGIDTQQILPFGTPEEVRRQVLERLEIFAPDGGYIFNSIHIVQCGTPVENIVAMIDAVHEFNGDK